MKWRTLNLADLSAAPHALDPLRDLGEVVHSSLSDDVAGELAKSDIYFASLKLPLTRQHLEKATRLRFIVTPSTGLDHIDLAAAAEYGKEVVSLKRETAFLDTVTATAEQTWGLLLAAIRKIPACHAAATRGEWARDRFRGHQLSGKTLGIVGYGRLGRIVASYGQAFRMRVLACDVARVRPEAGVELVDFATLLRECDVVSIHIHLTAENRHLFDRNAFSKMKSGAVLLNTSRGAIIDEPALLEALESGQLLAAGLDVIDGEWDENLIEHPVIAYARRHDNLVISPHVGGVTYESQNDVLRFMAEKAKARVLSIDPQAGVHDS